MSKLITVPLDKIKPNPWRDFELFPINWDHVERLKASINRHDFLSGIKARERNGSYEIACGHHRIEACKKAGVTSVEIRVADMTDDDMIDLMVRENAEQAHGSNAATVTSDVAAITRRLVPIILGTNEVRQICRTYPGLFETQQALDSARGKLIARINDPTKEGGVGRDVILNYLGGSELSPLGEHKVRDAISTLKMSGEYDQIVDGALRAFQQQHFQATEPTKKSKSKTVTAATAPSKPREPLIDPRCATVFQNDHQFRAFREAVTTYDARRFIPVDKQLGLAKNIVGAKSSVSFKNAISAEYIKSTVSSVVRDASRAQTEINEEEKLRLYVEQRGEEIKAEVKKANAARRALIVAAMNLIKLWKECPGHPQFGNIDAELGRLAKFIDGQFRKAMK
jgi:hypothetical protein